MPLPPVNQVASLSYDEKSKILGLLFEPCKALVDLALPILKGEAGDVSTWPIFINQIRVKLQSLDTEDIRVSEIIAAHPRLGSKVVDSAQSRAEQASLASSQDETADLKRWNDIYEQTFPGLRYVVFVAGRPRSEILKDMQRRVQDSNYSQEVKTAFDAMCDIALDREKKLIDDNELTIFSKY